MGESNKHSEYEMNIDNLVISLIKITQPEVNDTVVVVDEMFNALAKAGYISDYLKTEVINKLNEINEKMDKAFLK